MPAPVVMVHGAFCGGWVFDRFAQPFLAAGHEVHCPDLRGHAPGDGAQAAVGVSMRDYSKDVVRLCRSLPEPPILIGHSLGGLVCQMAAARTPVKGLVLLAPTAPWGVMAFTVEEALTAFGLQFLGPFWTRAIEPDLYMMRHFSIDRLPKGERREVLSRLKNESGRAMWEALNWWLDPFMTTALPSGPLKAHSLVLVGASDMVHRPAVVRETATRIGADFHILAGMSHWLPREPGWADVADQILAWAQTRQPVAA
jgi:pimeloyl-ACP methyl ester carboxylesterase